MGFQAPEDFEENPHPIGLHTDVFRFGKLIELLRPDLIRRFRACLYENPSDRPKIEEVCRRLNRMKDQSRYRFRVLAGTVLLMGIACVLALRSLDSWKWWQPTRGLGQHQPLPLVKGGTGSFQEDFEIHGDPVMSYGDPLLSGDLFLTTSSYLQQWDM